MGTAGMNFSCAGALYRIGGFGQRTGRIHHVVQDKSNLVTHITDDRQMYRPGEQVHVKGWLRRIGGKQDGEVGLIGSGVSNVRYRIVGVLHEVLKPTRNLKNPNTSRKKSMLEMVRGDSLVTEDGLR